MIIALDGPAGSGKSTVAKLIAKDNDLLYIDTGAMFRIITFAVLDNSADINNENEVIKIANNLVIEYENGNYKLNGNFVGDEIRTPMINQNVSKIAAYPGIRDILVKLQRDIASKNDSILDGRDIGTVVFPNAEFKFYLDASAEERANRRFEENKLKDNSQTYEEVLNDIIKRDELDKNREIAPLKQAEDAILIDTSHMNINEVVNTINKNIKR